MHLNITAGERGILALIRRAMRIDANAYARITQRQPNTLEVFATTPFSVYAARRAAGTASEHDAVYPAAALLEGNAGADNGEAPHGGATPGASICLRRGIDAAPAGPLAWPGPLPPADGYEHLETIPGAAVTQLADSGKQLARQFSSALGPPRSLLDSTVIECTDGEKRASIPMRAVFALNAFRFVPPAPEDPAHGRLIVSSVGRWVRLDAFYGSVYVHTGEGVLSSLL